MEKIKTDEHILLYIDTMKGKNPIITELENLYDAFHTLIMEDDPNKLDEFTDIYEEPSAKSL